MSKALLNKNAREIISLFNANKILILKELFGCDGDICGCDLVQKLKLPKNLISYHVKTLRELGFIVEVKCGKNKNYRIAPERHQKVKQILSLINEI